MFSVVFKFLDCTDDEKASHRLVFLHICFSHFSYKYSLFDRPGCFNFLFGFLKVVSVGFWDVFKSFRLLTRSSFQLTNEKISGFQLARRSP
jgi:hypothetical protein